jgi:phosphoglycolate phosphatase
LHGFKTSIPAVFGEFGCKDKGRKEIGACSKAWTRPEHHVTAKMMGLKHMTLSSNVALAPVVVLDLDGTLAETAPDLVATLNVILDREGMEPLAFEKARDLIGAGAKALIQRAFVVADKALSEARLEQLFDDYIAYYRDHIADYTTLFPGVITALDTLKREGFCLAVCTNKLEEHAVILLEKLGIMDRFAYLSGKDTFAFSKPDPRHLLETIRLAGGDPSRAVMVGDSKTDIDTAKAAGIPVVGVTFGYTDKHVTALGADIAIDHFDALPAAVRTVLAAAR